METRLTIVNSLDEMLRVTAWTDDFLAGRDDAEELGGKLHLVIEEMVTNVINHGYPDDQEGSIWLTLRSRSSGAVFFVEDEAPAFDPFERDEDVDTDAPLEARRIGGLGLFLVKEIADHLTYVRHKGRNRLGAWFGPELPEIDPDPESDSAGADRPPKDRHFRIGSSLAWRFGLSFLVVFVVGLGCAAALNFLKFERVFLETAARQYDPTLRAARRAIESSLGEGLTLASNFATHVVIDKTVEQYNGAFHLLMQDTSGNTLFESTSTEPMAPMPDGLAQRIATEEDGFTRFGDADGFGVAIVLRQSDDPVGMLVLTHDPQETVAEASRLREVLARLALLVGLVFAPLLALVSYAAMASIDRRHKRLADDLSRITHRHETEADGHDRDEYALLQNVRAIEGVLKRAEAPVSLKGNVP